MQDIAKTIGIGKVEEVVSDFYDRVRTHSTLRVPFGTVDDWTEHKAHLAHFWWVTLGGRAYRDKPYQVAHKHAMAGFTPALLVDWLALLRRTLDERLSPELAQSWYDRAAHIGRSLAYMQEFRQQQSRAIEGA